MKQLLKRLYASLPVIRELRYLSVSLGELRGSVHQIRLQLFNLAAAKAIQILDFELANHPRYADPVRLLKYAFQVCSQNGEDGMIQEIFRRIGTTNRVFAEVGIGNGTENNTAFLLSQGWSGFWVDGDPEFKKQIQNREDLKNDCLKYAVQLCTRENIAPLFAQLGVPGEFDLLSLDIDQNTYYLWEGLKMCRPRVVVVEYNSSIPPGIDWKARYDPARCWDNSINFGASLKAFELLGNSMGYSLVACDFVGSNAFFVRSDLVADKFAAPFTAENHYEPPRYSALHRRGHGPAVLDRQCTPAGQRDQTLP